jgi:hypothetical protein
MSNKMTKSEALTSERDVTSGKEAGTGCCGGAAPEGADACCALDADIKSTGGSGCGCGPRAASSAKQKRGCC